NEILKLLDERMRHVREIGQLKQISATSIYRPEREKEIIARLKSQSLAILQPPAIEAIYSEIFAISRNLELPEKIAFLGPEGSYSHQAAQRKFGFLGSYLPLDSIEAVFAALKNKETKYGVVPIENNTEGAVGVTLDCLGQYEDVKIIAEMYLDIHHSFATFAENIKEVQRIYSHPQGYNQCRRFLESHLLLELEFVPAKSTAAAAQLAAQEKSAAAICSQIAAKLFNVPVLFNKIEDNLANKTRFLILSDFKNASTPNDKTSIFAKTENRQGALVELLQSFQSNRINLTKIESRPLKGESFESVFYLDFEGHIDDVNVQKTLNENKDKHEIIWLGSYNKAL
ncbi:MAG: prephenate dehydratase, partial [Streptococcaceae bacterium]|nr:prephenate dehydratase [Streptococcaceae bacterium]